MFTEIRWLNKIYVIFQVARHYRKRSSIATAGAVTAFSGNVEVNISVSSSIQELKTGPFDKTADVKIKFVLE